jgi:hypothetical protein
MVSSRFTWKLYRDADAPLVLRKQCYPLNVEVVMRLRAIYVSMILAACCISLAQNKPDADSYEALIERVKSGDKTVDFRSLRLAYASSPKYSSRPDTTEPSKNMMSALRSKDFEKAKKNADVVLESKFVDIDAHYVEYIANRELHNPETAELHKSIAQALLKSITDSGDGKAPDTAYQVIEVHEEYVLLHFMGVGIPKSQSLLRKNGHAYDEIKFDDPESRKEVTLYFNVDISISHGQ